MQSKPSLNNFFQNAIKDNWERLSMTDFNGVSFQYKDVARKIIKLHLLYEHAHIKKGDKIALCGKNSSQWGVSFLSILTYGAVAVPILHEFKSDNIHHLVNHSEAKLLIVDGGIWENLDPESMPGLEGVLKLNDFSLLLSRRETLSDARAHLNEYFGQRFPERFTADDVVFFEDEPDEVALINYTSGSTGFSKGVMLTYRNLWSNLQYTIDKLPYLQAGDSVVSMLPMAHMYGLSVDFLQAFIKGVQICFLTRVPSPRVILEAFATVKPRIIVTVPLIIEKIVKGKVFPMLEKPLMKILMHVPFVDDRLQARIKAKLAEAFGGNCCEIIVGGAGLNIDVERFLRKIGFPYTVGYGMTECAPLISYAPWHDNRLGSCGKVVDRMEIKVDSPDPATIPGVLWTRGENVMAGYFKNQEATDAIMRDGWMSTGDICNIDHEGFLYIRGRDKNMILGPSGQNIYPEEIEQKLNNMPFVSESIVVEQDGRLVALIYPDIELMTAQGLKEADIHPTMEENLTTLNKELPAYSQLSRFKLFNEEFEKTPKRSIKRYLYQNS
ncbi:MAG: AMP-binding protein [Muribaculaceae bacterium]|nr:AMP-binding protein [Muribaculaceae bacterium]